MTALQHAVALLQQKIRHNADHAQRFTVQLDLPAETDLIDWLESQPLFPKFYWQSRDSREEVVALGQIKTFTDPKAAEKVLASQQRIWGGRSFDGRTSRNQRCLSSFFFLPVLELSRQDDTWQLAVNVTPEQEETVLATLSKIRTEATPVADIQSKILARTFTPDFNGWSAMIDQALDAITQREFEKVVLARKTTLTLDRPVAPAQLLKASRANNRHSFHFLMALDAKHCFVGSTPERLFLRQGEALHTEALAGTIGRGQSPSEDNQLARWLLEDSKNRYENSLVVDDIVSRLRDCCQSMTVAQTPELIRLRQVQHLKRGIDARLKASVDNADLLESLQPTAAIAGLPRDKALSFIQDHEPFARGWYSGSVGFLSRERTEFCVAIRSALIMGDDLHLFAGAGIVPGSTADSEWQELDRKTSTLCSLLQASDDCDATSIPSVQCLEKERKTA